MGKQGSSGLLSSRRGMSVTAYHGLRVVSALDGLEPVSELTD
jgi:hypothetical protein